MTKFPEGGDHPVTEIGFGKAGSTNLVSTTERSANRVYPNSSTVQHWMENKKMMFIVFEANRPTETHKWSKSCQWRYVRKEMNPVNLILRILNTCSMDRHSSSWMKHWPTLTDIESPLDIELKQTYETNRLVLRTVPSRLSDWFQLIRSGAWLIRFKTCEEDK